MFTRGEYQDTSGTYGVIVNREKTNIEVLLIESGSVISAFKHDDTGDYSFANVRAHDAERLISNGIRGCTSKNGNAIPFDLGTSIMHEFIRTKIEYIVELYNGELVGAEIKDEQKSKYLRLEYMKDQSFKIPAIPYVKLTAEKKKKKSADIDDMTVEDSVTVRSVSEIALEKEDVSWLKGKKYYIVNDDAQAEKLFKQLESYNGPIAYDTETTGLKINCFGKINSVYQRNLEKYNAEHPDDTIRADRMVGIIFCVEEDVSYYFPAFNRKFKNLYQDVDSPERIAAINNIKARYTVGDLAVQHDDDMYNYVTKTPAEEFRNDVVLMERVRNILEKGHIVGHNGTFDWKVGYQYGIDTNFKDDTMIMHQLMYKFRSTTSNRGESSALKYLEKREFGMDTWELEDFFPDFKEDNSGLTRGAKKKGSKIDFSYMDYDGTRVYAPTDGDATFKLFVKYKTDMMQNHKDMEYIYQVEMIVSSCIAYMEFYGHRLDERMINGARASTQAEVLCIESEIRDLVGYRSEKEKELYEKLSEQRAVYKDADASGDRDAINKAISEMEVTCKELRGVIDGDEEHPLNLAAPGQVATLFYDILKIPNPNTEGKKSVAKRELKALLKERNADGTPKYPVVHMYSEYKKQDTLVTKFFDNLQYFQYPGGYIFSSYGQIAAATGRMSCSRPNAQQYPHSVTKMVKPRPGYLMADADYSQIEYRVLTALAGNEWLAELFSNPDSDYHTLMASLMYEVPYASVTGDMRKAAKSFNFGIPYGMGFASLAILLTGNSLPASVEEAKIKYEQYFKNQPKTRKFFDTVKEQAQVNKYTETFWHRRRYYSFEDKDGKTNNARKAAALRQAGNAVIQGCVDGDTVIETKTFGKTKIKDVCGYSGEVWNGSEWTHGDVLYSGKKQKCIISLSNGHKFICSPIHKFLTGSDAKNIDSYTECKDLVVGTKLKCDNNSTVEVLNVDITDEYIDMYDVCNTDCGYYVADGIITHNTAADVFKISVARNFKFIRDNHLLGKILIINMIHDEQLFEIDTRYLNIKKVITCIGKNMQFKIDGFPPLYIGAGVGASWDDAKGKDAEIHPTLLENWTKEMDSYGIWVKDPLPLTDDNMHFSYDFSTGNDDPNYRKSPDEWLKMLNDSNMQFRINKVKDYLMNPENKGKVIEPVIGNLLNLKFKYGHSKKEGLTDDQLTKKCLEEFIKHNGLEGICDPADYLTQEEDNALKNVANSSTSLADTEDTDEDAGYDDSDDENGFTDIDEEGEFSNTDFIPVDESDVAYGCTVQDLIQTFGNFVSKSRRICGIDMRNVSAVKADAIVDYLYEHVCDDDAPGAMEIMFLQDCNILKRTGIFVNNIDGSEVEKRLRNASAKYDFDERVQ